MTQFDLILELMDPQPQALLRATYGDTDRALRFHLRCNGQVWPLPQDVRPVFTALKSDGTVLYNSCTAENGAVIYQFTPQTTSCPGLVRCQLRLIRGEKLLSSPEFQMEVEDTVYHDGDAIDSSSEASELNGLIDEVAAVLDHIYASLENGAFQGEKGEPGEKGEKGDRGETGPQGKPFTYADFTQEQLDDLYADTLQGVLAALPVWEGGSY